MKVVIPKEIGSHLVYKLTCSCCNATYYGKSERYFFARASEHLGMTPLTAKRLRNPKTSAIFDYIFLKGERKRQILITPKRISFDKT